MREKKTMFVTGIGETTYYESLEQCERCGEFFKYSTTYDYKHEPYLCKRCEQSLPYGYEKYLNTDIYRLKPEIQKQINATNYSDKIMICEVCNDPFVYSAAMQKYDASLGILERFPICSTCFHDNCFDEPGVLETELELVVEDLGITTAKEFKELIDSEYPPVFKKLVKVELKESIGIDMLPKVQFTFCSKLQIQIENAFQKLD